MQSALDRRQAMLELLSDRRQETVANLMAEFGVSRCTVLRDVDVINRIGYTMSDLCGDPHGLVELEVCLHEQSKDISAAVGKAELSAGETLGAGDQGIMVGYATNETEEYLPLPVVLAQRICRRLDELKPENPWLGADGKAQVTVAYENHGMNDWFSWNGKKCTEYGIHVLEQPPITIPAERATFTIIPGRPGSLTTLEGDDVYDDLILTAQCMISDPNNIRAIASYLKGSGKVAFANRLGGLYFARIVNQILITTTTGEFKPKQNGCLP